jgi:hypothetical protein
LQVEIGGYFRGTLAFTDFGQDLSDRDSRSPENWNTATLFWIELDAITEFSAGVLRPFRDPLTQRQCGNRRSENGVRYSYLWSRKDGRQFQGFSLPPIVSCAQVKTTSFNLHSQD